mgnify:CR=1 FL=1|jgi:hypothetical protein
MNEITKNTIPRIRNKEEELRKLIPTIPAPIAIPQYRTKLNIPNANPFSFVY